MGSIVESFMFFVSFALFRTVPKSLFTSLHKRLSPLLCYCAITIPVLAGLPPELYTIWEAYPWRFGEPYCLLKTFLTEMTSSVSCLTITAFTLERYVAICHPLRAQAMSSLHRAVKTIVFIWIVSAAAALPYPIHTRSFYYINHPGTHEPIADSLICNIEVGMGVSLS